MSVSVQSSSGHISYPLSFSQSRPWLYKHIDPNHPLYTIPLLLRFKGIIDRDSVKRSLDSLLQRHRVLRACCIVQAESFSLGSVADASLQVTQVSDVHHEQVQQLIIEEIHSPFDLEAGPLLRTTLFCLGETEHMLLVIAHHLVFDQWSAEIFLREFIAFYEAFTTETTFSFAELPMHYSDYSAWQREWLQGKILENHLTYWRQQLDGALPLLELPTDFPRPAVQTLQGGYYLFALAPALKKTLQDISAQEETTLFTTLLAAFQTVLYRYSGQEDIVVGTSVDGRIQEDTQGLIGCFANILALRAKLTGELTFRELIRQMHTRVSEAYTHQDLPFAYLVEELHLERNLSYHPLFQVLFALQSSQADTWQLPNSILQRIETAYPITQFDLTLEVVETPEGLQGRVEYSTDLFELATIERLMKHWRVLLEAVTASPDHPIGTLSLLTEQEKHQLLLEWNATHQEYPTTSCIHQLFEVQAARTPAAPALLFEGTSLTYRELNERANQLAHYLQSKSVGPEVLVGIYMERAVEMVVAVLGILKAGGAYVPLDPSYPAERLAFMLEDTAAPIVLSQAHVVPGLPEYQGEVLCLDKDSGTIAREKAENLQSPATVENLAYVIYTSGSTGKPKGVAMRHAALVNLIMWQVEDSSLGIGDKTLQFTSLSFDVSFQEMFSTWCSGGNLVMVSEELRKDIRALLQFLKEERVQRVFLPFVALQQLAQIADTLKIAPTSLCEIITAGEQLQLTVPIINLLSHISECTLYNQYGPTEGHVVTTFCFKDALKSCPYLPPIGRPVANTRVYILDRYQQPVPVGVAGELSIGGVQLARGYLNRPDLTAEKFIEHTFEDGRTERLYRTGDLARYLPDGNIEYLGRIDHQVKVRGFRIELGEIETVLGEHPHIGQCVVAVREDVPGDKRLVAYVVVKEDKISSVGEWQTYLKKRIPEYMVPTVFEVLEELPLTPSGKVDRKRLPVPTLEHVNREDYVSPHTQVEKRLGQIWSDVLRIQQVGIHDRFFELGGHSLLAMQVVSRVREAFGVELSLRNMFEHTTLATLGHAVEFLLATQSMNLGSTLQRRILRSPENTTIFPLSLMQQRLWFLNQLAPDNPFYNISFALRLKGNLQVPFLRQALQEIVDRHEALHTTFVVQDGQPRQSVAPGLQLEFPVIEVPGVTQSEKERHIAQLVERDAQQLFDLARGPLIRTTLLRVSDDEHILLFAVHHIVFDGWSEEILLNELAALYTAFVAGCTSPLAPLAIRYVDYVQWQQHQLQSNALAEHLSYWRKQFECVAPLLELPTDHPRSATQTFKGSQHAFCVSKRVLAALQELSLHENSTLFMTLLAVFQVLLYRYSGQEDLVIGTPVAGRGQEDIEGMIGCFVNTLALRTKLAREMTFRELLALVREVMLEAYTHQDLPFDLLVEELHIERSLSYNPLFQVMFTLQNITEPLQTFAGLSASLQENPTQTAQFDLILEVVETPEGLQGRVEYSTDLFEPATIERLMKHWQVLLEAVTASPDHPIGTLSLLTEQEKHQLLLEWNATHQEYPTTSCIHQLFEVQAARTPAALALLFEGTPLTYRELNERANQLAHYLQSKSVGPEVLVGIYMERAVEMVVAVLGILKAGGAYVPLDPSYPAERLAFMLKNTGVTLLLTQKHLFHPASREVAPSLAAVLPGPSTPYELLYLDADWPLIASYTANEIVSGVTSEHLAYVIFTSGSTGQPKGVMVPHRSLVNSTVARSLFYRKPVGRFLLLSSYAFDSSVAGIFWTLCQGGTLILPSPGDEQDLSRISFLIATSQVTHVLLLPSLYYSLLEEEDRHRLTHLQTVIIAGEPCSPQMPILHHQSLPHCSLFNEYGPTEGTVWSTCYRIDDNDFQSTVPIGRPIANVSVYVLDPSLQLVPSGVPGELYIGGAGVARGYLAQSELTAERFVPNPFAGTAGERLYKTGDLVRYRADGVLEFLGRTDHQVKLRGFRIELGEIEIVLHRHPAVQDCVVVMREETPGEKRLVAYVVLTQEGEEASPDLRVHLRASLPEYMLPTFFVILPALPLAANGKLDRQALPVPEAMAAIHSRLEHAPRTPTEEILVVIWQALLNLDYISTTDHFFEIGGHSLLATRLAARIRQAFLIEFPLRLIFTAPILADLARYIERARNQATIALPMIQPARDQAILPLSFGQEQLWFLHQLAPQNTAYHIPLGVRLVGDLAISVLQSALQAMVERHAILRTTFVLYDGQPVQSIKPSLPLSLPLIDLTNWPGETREIQAWQVISQEIQRPFDLEQGPLQRQMVIRLASDEHILVLTCHHSISDGWSQEIFLRELSALYTAFRAGEPSLLSPVLLQYADYAVWQHQQSAEVARQLEYWREHLADAPAVLDVPTDHPRPGVPTFAGATYRFQISPVLTQEVRQLSRQEQATPYMVLLAAYHVLLARYSGQTDIVVGSPIAGRTRVELENMLGFLVNTLALRVNLAENSSFAELVRQVRDVTLQAYAHQDVPFEYIVRSLQPERALSHSPIFQVMFVMQNTAQPLLALPDISCTPIPLANQIAKYDLTMTLVEQGELLCGEIEYNTDLFEAATIERFSSHYLRLLEEIARDARQPVLNISLLTEAEYQQQVIAWNATTVPLPEQACLPQLFEQQAARVPEEIALIQADQQVSYGELNQRANRLAHYLRELGVGPERLVGLCVERSLEMVVGVLGVLKAGGTYIPIDITYPNERIAFILKDTQPSVVLTQQHLRERTTLLVQNARKNRTDMPAVICLDDEASISPSFPSSNPTRNIMPDNLAYVIYTSGSTGQPKGAMITHRGLLNYLLWAVHAYEVAEGNGAPLVSSIAFDLTVTSLFTPLLAGRSVTLLPKNVGPEVLGHVLDQEHSYSLVKITPAHLEILNQQVSAHRAAQCTRFFVIGGEQIYFHTLEYWRANAPATRLINEYGPTETAVGCCTYEVQPEDPVDGPVPIGRPIANTQLYVLDHYMQPVPLGVPGELYIGGAGVARGYLARPELTAERFVPNPFAGTAGERLYKTGDLVRYRADGVLEFLGRTDHQVKLRGFRIELGEIETVLHRHPAVQDCVVVMREETPGEKRLVAYVVLTQEGEEASPDLRAHLRASLPEYMLPAFVVILPALPFSTNGKVNRQALPSPEPNQLLKNGIVNASISHAQSKVAAEHIAPRDNIERQIAIIWQSLLGFDAIGIYDDFFEVGGHSLLLTQLVSRLRNEFQVNIQLVEVFERRTIASMAILVTQAQVEFVDADILAALLDEIEDPPTT